MTEDKIMPIKLIIKILAVGILILSCSSPNEPPDNVIAGVGSYVVKSGDHYHITVWVDTTQAADYILVGVRIDQWDSPRYCYPEGAERIFLEFETPPNQFVPGTEYTVSAGTGNETVETTGVLP